MTGIEWPHPGMRRVRTTALILGAAALILCAVGAFLNPKQFFHSYLIAYLFVLAPTLGSMALVMLYHLTSGYWGLILRRILESATRLLPFVALLAVPLFFGLPHLYEWSHPEVVQADPLLQAKQFYLTVPFFIARQVIYFAIWLSLAYFLNRLSSRQDETDDPEVLRKLRSLSGPGLLLYGVTITFAAFDWVMSLEPHYYSTTFGFRLMTGQAVHALAFGVLAALLLPGATPVSGLITRKRLRDLGNLMLASVLLWAYIAFTEYLIIWAANLPHETSWFRNRFWAGWGVLAWCLLVFHFFVPFFLLLQRHIKHRPATLGGIASWLILMRLVELFWMVEPAQNSTFSLHWMDAVAPVGLAGIWLAGFLWQLEKRPLVPLYDPLYLEESNEHHAPA